MQNKIYINFLADFCIHLSILVSTWFALNSKESARYTE